MNLDGGAHGGCRSPTRWSADGTLEISSYGVRTMIVERNPAATRRQMDVTDRRSTELFRRPGDAEHGREAAAARENCVDVARAG
jgi:hypothetical protein